MKGGPYMREETTFTIFCLENYKEHRGLTGKETFDLFTKYGVFDCYSACSADSSS